MITIAGGIVLGLLSIAVSTIMDGNGFGALVGPSSVVLVLFGTIGIAMTGFELEDLKAAPKSMIKAYTGAPVDSSKTVTLLATLSDLARKEGVLALESKLETIDDEFVRKGIQLVVDGADADQIATVLEIDIASMDERHKRTIGFWDQCVAMAPTMGMVGTVIGLINMLGNLSSPEELGKGMSGALLTTLYGVIFANMIFAPVGEKLKNLNKNEMAARDMMIDGVLTVQAGSSPRMLVERLETYLAPAERVGYQERLKAA